MLFILFYSFVTAMTHGISVGDEPIDCPYLQPHFSVKFRGGSFEFLDGTSSGDSVRRIRDDKAFETLIDGVRRMLPPGKSISRTYLRSYKLGWVQGGHLIDAMEIDPIDFEGILISKGEILRPVDDYQFMICGQHRFVLEDKDGGRVVSLYLPGGFEATASNIDHALRMSLLRLKEDGVKNDWAISFSPTQLIDRELWDPVVTGLQVALQPSDLESEVNRSVQGKILHFATSLVAAFARDVSTVNLTAEFGSEEKPHTVRLVVDFWPDSESLVFLRAISRSGVAEFELDTETMPPAVGAVCLPESLSHQTPVTLKEWPLADGKSQLMANHLMFAWNGQVGTPESQLVSVVGYSDQRLREWNDIEPLVLIATKLNKQFSSVCSAPSELMNARMKAWFGSIRVSTSPMAAAANAGDRQSGGFFLMKLDLRQLASSICPDLGAGDAPIVVSVKGYLEGNRLIFSMELPIGSEPCIYLLFEDVFCWLKHLGEMLPFETLRNRR